MPDVGRTGTARAVGGPMSRVIWKFPLMAPEVTLLMPLGAVPCHVDYDPSTGAVTIWAEVDPDPAVPRVERSFAVVATGEVIEDTEYVEKLKVDIMGEAEPKWIDGETKKAPPIYLGTCFSPNATLGTPETSFPLVWHVYERIKR